MEIHFKKLIQNAPRDRIQIQSLISTEKNLFEVSLNKNIKINYLVDAKRDDSCVTTVIATTDLCKFVFTTATGNIIIQEYYKYL